jgi:hypothetical protein
MAVTSTNHAMPAGIRRIEKGVYRTLDDRHEIRQYGKVWRLAELVGDSTVGIGEYGSRNAAVAALATDGKLPEAPKPQEPKAAEEMPAKELTEVKPELHPDAEAKPRPTRRTKKEAKAS